MSDAPEKDHRDLVHDLRTRVLDGEDISPEGMFLIIDQIRAGRRSAGAPPSKAKGKSAKGSKGATKANVPDVDLVSLMDQEIP